MTKNIAIIGAGFGGISSAALLSKAGFKVSVFEKNSQPGGRAMVKKEKDFTFDLGPSWYMMPEVFEKFFTELGEDISQHLKLTKLNPTYRAFFSDDFLDIPPDKEKLGDIFEKMEKGSKDRFLKVMDESEFLYNEAINKFLYKDMRSVLDFIDVKFGFKFMKRGLFRSYNNYIKSKFKNIKIQNLLSWHSIFVGGTPRKVPALYILMLHADINLGTYYPQGGMGELVRSMVKISKKYGTKFHYDSPVEKIITEEGKVKGILVNGKEKPFDIVLSNADYKHTESLLEESTRSYSEKYWEKQKMSPSTYLLFLGLNKKLKNLIHHNYYFSERFEEHLDTIDNGEKWPSAPSFYISVPSKSDKSIAPENKENLMLLVPLAPGIEDNDDERSKMRNYLLAGLSKLIGENVEDLIEVEFDMGPKDFENIHNAYMGNSFGLANTLFQTGSLRPRMKSNKLNNLYFTGTTTLPGIGVPLALISGEIAAKRIVNEYER